jgi:hypothetical protein
MRNANKILVEESEGKRPLGRPMPRWEYNTEWILGTLGGRVWTGFTWLRIGTSDRLL